MDWCYLDTSFNGITFVVLSAREICGLGFGDLGRALLGREFDDFFDLTGLEIT
jgi:hypothetical protein